MFSGVVIILVSIRVRGLHLVLSFFIVVAAETLMQTGFGRGAI